MEVTVARTDPTILNSKQLIDELGAANIISNGPLKKSEACRKLMKHWKDKGIEHHMLSFVGKDDRGEVPYAFLKSVKVELNGRSWSAHELQQHPGPAQPQPRNERRGGIRTSISMDFFDTLGTPRLYTPPSTLPA